MKPIKMKYLKHSWTVEETMSNTPIKKKVNKEVEKENKNSDNTTFITTRLKRSKLLENSTYPNKKANIKVSQNRNNLSCDDSDIDLLDEMFLQLKKNGIKTVNSNSYSNKSPTSNLNESKDNILSKKHFSEPKKQSLTSTNQKQRKNLENEFNALDDSFKYKTNLITSSEDKITELSKLSENYILNCKRTPVKTISSNEDRSPKKDKSVETPLRRSTRRKSIISKNEIFDLRKTPVKIISKTQSKKSSSPQKKGKEEPKTPSCKIEKRLPSTPLEKARLSLHVSTVPDCLPCREKEYNEILTFLENKLWDGIGGCMYISGVPGTGKTATVTQVIKHLQDLSKKSMLPEFKYVEINGMRLADPRQAYVQLWQKIFDKKDKITSDRALRLLDSWFSKNNKDDAKKTTVLVVDELDLICTKKQDVVYNLLDWPTRTHSRLVVLTIANTMDMPERLFKGRVTSRMGLTRLTFLPYTHKQLEEIVLARLNGLNVFVTDAVRLVTRKVAAVSGDARRALDICRRAAELPPSDEIVKISHIEQAIREMTNSNIIKVIRNCGEMEKIFLRSLSDVSFRSNVEEVDLRDVIDQLLAVCVLEGISRPSVSTILSVSNRLKCCRLIFTNQSNAGILQRLTLNVTHDDIHYALRT